MSIMSLKLFVILIVAIFTNAATLDYPIMHPYPFVVSLQSARDGKLTKIGAGVIVSDSFVLTTASSVNDKITKESDDLYVLAGVLQSYELDYKYAQLRKVVDIIMHPKYSDFSNGKIPKNDLALLKVDKPFRTEMNVQIAKLNPNSEVNGIGDIIGWGASDIPSHSSQSDWLLYATLPVANQADCQKTYNFVGNDKFCVGTNEQVACTGDGGGPFVQFNQATGESIVAGVVSVGAVPCTAKPALYTNVGHYLNFIKETIGAVKE